VLSPCPPHCGGGALGVSGIQIDHWHSTVIEFLDSRHAVPKTYMWLGGTQERKRAGMTRRDMA
jgi:hypothetical protein